MERDGKNNQNKKKRARDNHDESWPHKSKKPLESVVVVENNIIDDQEKPCYEFCDSSSIGVFDFPWLNEGVGFTMVDEYFEPEEKFAPINFDDGNSFVGDGNLQEENNVDDYYEHGFNWSLKVDDLEPVDNCIWSFVIDQPLS